MCAKNVMGLPSDPSDGEGKGIVKDEVKVDDGIPGSRSASKKAGYVF
jgi:hypothetical protein